MSRKKLVKGIEVSAVARRGGPLARALDGRSLGPFVERQYKLPASVRGQHRPDVASPTREISGQPRRRLALLVEAGRDHERIGSEVVLRQRSRVLVPGVRLRCAGAKASERLEDDVGTDRVRLAPAPSHRVAAIRGIAVDVHDEAPADLQVRRLRRIPVADVLEVGADLLDAGVLVALALVVDRPAKRRRPRCGEVAPEADVGWWIAVGPPP